MECPRIALLPLLIGLLWLAPRSIGADVVLGTVDGKPGVTIGQAPIFALDTPWVATVDWEQVYRFPLATAKGPAGAPAAPRSPSPIEVAQMPTKVPLGLVSCVVILLEVGGFCDQ